MFLSGPIRGLVHDILRSGSPLVSLIMRELVADVVRRCLDKAAEAHWVTDRAAVEISATDCARFIEVIETELGSLHEGNIAWHRLRPQEYHSWKQGWR